jgi:hypothetical protein
MELWSSRNLIQMANVIITYILAYLPIYPPTTYLLQLTYLPIHSSIHLLTYYNLPSYLATHPPTPPTYLQPTYISTHPPTYLPTYYNLLTSYAPTYPTTTYLPPTTYLPTHLLPINYYLPIYLSTHPPTY